MYDVDILTKYLRYREAHYHLTIELVPLIGRILNMLEREYLRSVMHLCLRNPQRRRWRLPAKYFIVFLEGAISPCPRLRRLTVSYAYHHHHHHHHGEDGSRPERPLYPRNRRKITNTRYKQDTCAIAKMTAQYAIYMGALKIFGTP